ncbi:MAG: hypothetical protein KDA84_19540, partial [Planctomycetaceae bacterium]|nr:hypothetical protein [Planctomycetaceae bacterium]
MNPQFNSEHSRLMAIDMIISSFANEDAKIARQMVSKLGFTLDDETLEQLRREQLVIKEKKDEASYLRLFVNASEMLETLRQRYATIKDHEEFAKNLAKESKVFDAQFDSVELPFKNSIELRYDAMFGRQVPKLYYRGKSYRR